RNGIRGQEGLSLLKSSDEVEEDDEPEEAAAELKGIGSLNVPKRKIYAIDLRDQTDPNVYIEEIRRIASEAAVEVVSLGGLLGSSSGTGNGHGNGHAPLQPVNRLTTPAAPPASLTPLVLEGTEPVRRRWYPVIDYSRCTNCMECIDFCLFGVYGVDNADRILVEQQDNCKKGCPACSRVCPENAIIFPEHKTPSIAGAAVAGAGDFKIDLSKLFGAPDALEIAVLERDRELVADGRDAVGTAVGLPKRQEHQKDQPRDSLDDLMDGLDVLDL
ncbi:MAG TPA: ferredoxin family protein, partial [Planctomycetaceae bacterium]|nr:ferredoxin family protein [Planctomycetaceae bacterium]